jgi:hypothetical protein
MAKDSGCSKDLVREDGRWKVLVVLTQQKIFPPFSNLQVL